MEVSGLEQRLAALEQAREQEIQRAAQQAFMNRYGSRIGNNEGLGLFILNEMNRRGIDTSAASDAVLGCIEQIRQEAEMLLDTMGAQHREEKAHQEELHAQEEMNRDAANDLIDRADKMEQAVQTAMAASGMQQTSGDAMQIQAQGMLNDQPGPAPAPAPTSEELGLDAPMPGGEGGDMPPPEGGGEGGDMAPPPEAGGEGGDMAPPSEAGGEGGDMAPPPEGGGEAPEIDEQPPVGSDRRIKSVLFGKYVPSDRRLKHIRRGMSSISNGILNACLEGY